MRAGALPGPRVISRRLSVSRFLSKAPERDITVIEGGPEVLQWDAERSQTSAETRHPLWWMDKLMRTSSPPFYMQLECTIRSFCRDKAIPFFLNPPFRSTDSFVLCGLIRYSKSSGFICHLSSQKINIFINSHLVENINNKSGLNKSVNIQNSAGCRGRARLYAVSQMICMKNGSNISCQTVICAWRRSRLATQTSIVGWKCERYCCAGLNKTEYLYSYVKNTGHTGQFDGVGLLRCPTPLIPGPFLYIWKYSGIKSQETKFCQKRPLKSLVGSFSSCCL